MVQGTEGAFFSLLDDCEQLGQSQMVEPAVEEPVGY